MAGPELAKHWRETFRGTHHGGRLNLTFPAVCTGRRSASCPLHGRACPFLASLRRGGRAAARAVRSRHPAQPVSQLRSRPRRSPLAIPRSPEITADVNQCSLPLSMHELARCVPELTLQRRTRRGASARSAQTRQHLVRIEVTTPSRQPTASIALAHRLYAERPFGRGNDIRPAILVADHSGGYSTRRKGLRAGPGRAGCSLPGRTGGARQVSTPPE
jgi:hypothetical protein